MTSTTTIVRSPAPGELLVRTARTTGLLYLALAIVGMLGFLVFRPALFSAQDPAATLANLVAREQMARLGIALEMAIAITQTLLALWFFRLFRAVDDFAAGAIAVLGLVSAIIILVSAAALATALQVALAPSGLDSGAAQLMHLLSTNAWQTGNVFFGLWLIPMGWCVLKSRWMPRALGWVLIAGGAGYVLNAFVGYLAPAAGPLAGLLVLPAMIGEFWMIGYLLIRGVAAGQAA